MVYEKLVARFPQFKAHSPIPASLYLELARNCSILKSIWYSLRFGGIVMVGRGSKIRVHRSASVILGAKSALAIGLAHDTPAGAVLRMRPRATLRVEGRVQFMRACSVTVGYDAALTIGAGTFLNDGSSLTCDRSVMIGAGCAISSGVRILDTDVHKLIHDEGARPDAPVCIGRACWIGTNAVILKGTELGEGSVVAAGAVVRSGVPPRSLVAGVPGRVMRRDITWML